jgi:putative membrane protein
MTRRTNTIVAAAAGMIFSTGGFALAQAQSGSQSGQTGSSMRDMSSRDASGSSADRQINQELRQIAQDPKTAADKLFVLHAAMGNRFETELARQAEQKAQNSQVKQVAQRILQDHQKAEQQLQQVAQQLGLQLPTSLPEDKQQEIQILASLPTDQFEKEYISKMQADHAKDVIAYRNCGQNAQNSQVKSYATQQLPVLQQHESHVNQAAVALGLPSAGEAIPASGRMQGSSGNSDMGASGSMRTGGSSSINETSGSSGAANPISPANTGAPSTPNGSTIGATGTPNSSNNSTGSSNGSGR